MELQVWLFGPSGEPVRLARRIGFVSPAARERGEFDVQVVAEGSAESTVAVSAVASTWLEGASQEEVEDR